MFNDAFSWLTQDPIGKKVGIGLLIALGIVAIYAAASMLKWAGENIKPLMFCALVIGGVVYLGILFNVGWEIWAIFGGICLATLGAIGFAMANKQ